MPGRACTRRQALAALCGAAAWLVPARPSAAVAPAAGASLAPEYDVLVRTVWGESRGERLAGMRAVCAVILNRVRSPHFPDTIRGVCLQPYQFSVWNPGFRGRARLRRVGIEDPSFVLAMRACTEMLTGATGDPTHRADHYHSIHDGKPAWARGRKPVATIGRHRFYRVFT